MTNVLKLSLGLGVATLVVMIVAAIPDLLLNMGQLSLAVCKLAEVITGIGR